MSEMPADNQSSLLKYVLAGAGVAVLCLCLVLVAAGGYYYKQGKATLPMFEPTATPQPVFTATPVDTATPPVPAATFTEVPLPTETSMPENTSTPAATQSPKDMAKALSVVITGEGVPEAAEYQKSEKGPHLIVLLSDTGEFHDWNKNLRPEWVPTNMGQVELAATVTYINTVVATQKYTGCGQSGPVFISRIRRDTLVVLYEAKTGKTISSETFLGEEPPSFDWSTKCSTTAFYGNGVNYVTIQEWLRPFIAP